MTDYYILEASTNVEEFTYVKKGMKKYETFCQMSEFQFLDRNPITVEVDEDSGKIFQDFLCDMGVPIVSDRLKNCLDDLGVDYLFYKKVVLTKSQLGIEEVYWLALPPRINCLNMDKSEVDEYLGCADKIVINDDRVGRYEIFKLDRVTNLDIIISKRVADVLKSKKFVGLHINKLSDCFE